MYAGGASEEFLGGALHGAAREKLFIATKVVKGIDRSSILESIDESLRRLRMEYVDLYMIHWPVVGMDLTVMMAALDEVVRKGKARLVGCCNFPAYLVAAANAIAAKHGWPRLVCNQVAYNLIERGVEVEILPQAVLERIAITAYRPLAVGLLAGKLRPGVPLDMSTRGCVDSRVITWLSQYGSSVERFFALAEEKGVQPAQLATAWVAYSPAVTAPIVGVTSLDQLEAAVLGMDIQLSEQKYRAVTMAFDTEVKEEGLQQFPGLKYNFPRMRRNLNLARR
jgi:1-deoxyxylulose-5-phosphate synthase